ncbi:MAG TPA: hypothetical protein VJA16_19525, partial [Thermoanaerobaculia bacterium]
DKPETATLIAHYVFARLPHLIRTWLTANVTFRPELQLGSTSHLTIGGEATFTFDALIAAARSLWDSSENQALTTVDGTPAVVILSDGVACLHLSHESRQPGHLLLPALGLLSPDRQVRLQALAELQRQLGPTAPDLASLQQVATDRPLSDEELHQVFRAIETALPSRQARLRHLLSGGSASLDDLVPDSWPYFERFCGPDPGAADPRAYLASTLTDYRRGLLQADLRHGLQICLLGAVRDDLCPGEWLEPYGDDELWNALQACKPAADPLSLLAALDIALHRQHDARFAAFAEQAVAALLADAYPLPGGDDFYQLFPFLVELTLQRLTFRESGMSRPPFWRRLCAWMEAALVTRLLPANPIDLAALTHAIENNLSPEGQCAKLVDLRREPLVHPGQLSPPFVRAELRGRLWLIARRHHAAGRTVPRMEGIDQALIHPDDQGAHLLRFMPGPLDGHRQLDVAIPPELDERLRHLPAADLPAAMAFYSRTWTLPAEHRDRLRALLAKPAIENLQLELSRLEYAALVAAADRDRPLADAVATAGLAVAPRLRQPTEVPKLFHTLVIAAAAHQDEPDCATWLGARLAELAGRIPAGSLSVVYWHCLEALSLVTNVGLRIADRALAIAAAAMF